MSVHSVVPAAEPDYCKRGVKVSEAYQHCFEEAHFLHPYLPLRQHHDILDGCMVEAYATHTCRSAEDGDGDRVADDGRCGGGGSGGDGDKGGGSGGGGGDGSGSGGRGGGGDDDDNDNDVWRW